MATPKKAAKKKGKKRPSKYEEKLVINGTFEDVMKVLVTPKGLLNVPPLKKDK